MKFSKKTAGILATSVMATLVSLSAFADSRPQSQTGRYDNDRYEDRNRNDRDDRYDDRDRYDRNDRNNRVATIAGVIERIDRRSDVIILRDARSGRNIAVDMDRFDKRNGRHQWSLNDLRRGDFVRLTGEWDRDGFEARRIEDVRQRRRDYTPWPR
jgi:hypothetical protein